MQSSESIGHAVAVCVRSAGYGSDSMEVKNLGTLIDAKERDVICDHLKDKGWQISDKSRFAIVMRHDGDVRIILESGFLLDTDSQEDDNQLAKKAYRKVLPEATADLRQLTAILGSHWNNSVPDAAAAIDRFETFLSGWRACTGDVWPDGWERLLAECHRLAAMRHTDIEERRSQATLMQSWVSLIVALSAFLVSVIPLGWPDLLYDITVVVVITLVILLYIEQWRALSGRRLIADNLDQRLHRFTRRVRRTYRKNHRQR